MPARSPVQLQRAGVHALVRLLVDAEPPYRMLHLARAAAAITWHRGCLLRRVGGVPVDGRTAPTAILGHETVIT